MNKLGYKVFINDLRAFNDIPAMEIPTGTIEAVIKPITRLKLRTLKLLNQWTLIVGVSFGLLTLKIVIEQLVSRGMR